jgi:hypothetical protein
MSAVRVLGHFAFTLFIGLSAWSFEAGAVDVLARTACSENTGGIGGTGLTDEPGGIGGTGQRVDGGISGTGQRAEGGIGGTGIAPSDESTRPVAGRVLFVKGTVEAVMAGMTSRTLAKGDWVCEGDTLVSGKAALAQILMKDGGTLVVRADTKLVIEKFSFKGAIDGTERLALLLEKGGFRAITGSIGKVHKENYSIRTSTVVIGIRGTDHETYFVPFPQPGEKPVAEPGTYNRVISGGTIMRTERGVLSVNPNQIGFAPFKGAPRLLPSAPPFFNEVTRKLHGRVDNSFDARDESDKGDIIQPITIANGAIDLGYFVGQFTAAPVGTASVGTHVATGSVSVGGLVTDNIGLIVLIDDAGLPGVITNRATNYNYVTNFAPLVDFGSAIVDSMPVIWGIYAGGTTFDIAGNPSPVDFHHFALATGGATPDQVITSMNGTATFSNVVGFTKPTNELGGIGGGVTINTGIQLGASPAVTSYNIGVVDANSRTWAGAFAGSVPLLTFAQSGVPLSVTCTGAQCGAGAGTGNATGILIGPSAKGLITSYGLATTTGQRVGGAAVLSRP